MADIPYLLEFAGDEPPFTILRFPHDYEESFIKFTIQQFRPIRITRQDDGVILYEAPDR